MVKLALFFILGFFLQACGGSSEPQVKNPFQQAIGQEMPSQPLLSEPKDPFAPLLGKIKDGYD